MSALKLRVYPPESDGVASGLAAVLAGSYDVPLEFREPPVILDIGAHVGSFSVWAAHRWPGATITAFEPSPSNADYARQNLEGIAEVVERAVVGPGRPGALLLHEGRDNTGQRSIHRLGEQKAEGLMVRTRRASTLPPCDIFKADTEGCELEILDDYRHLSTVRAVMLEYHSLEDYHTLLKLLPSRGLTLVRNDTGGRWAHDRNLIFVRGT